MSVSGDLGVELFADSASTDELRRHGANPLVTGFTTNASLIRSSDVRDYPSFVQDVLEIADGRPVSFAVVSDDPVAIEREARLICGWGKNVFAKVPVCTSKGAPL